MKEYDVYLRKRIIEADLYLRELVLNENLTVYNDLMLRSQLALLLMQRYTSGQNSTAMDSGILQAYSNVYEILTDQLGLTSEAAAYSTLYTKAAEGLSFDVDNLPAGSKLYTQANNLLMLTGEMLKNAELFSTAELKHKILLESSLAADLVQLTSYAAAEDIGLSLGGTAAASFTTFFQGTNGFHLSSNAIPAAVSSYSCVKNMLELSAGDLPGINLFSGTESENFLRLNSSATPSQIASIQLQHALWFTCHVSEMILSYLGVIASGTELSSSEVDAFLRQYRKFSQMDALKFDDIKNMTMDDLVYITT